VDGGGDVVEPGAYTKTLKDQGNKRPMLWQHKTDVPIGELTLEDRPEGLWCTGQLLMALPEAQKAYLLIKAKIVKGLSIGFAAVKDAVENGVRKLKEIKLYEGSVVTFPMNETALIASVKARAEGKGDFNEELNEIQLQDAGYQMFSALRYALGSLVWADLTREEKITAAEVVIQQFTDAWMAYFPAYIDLLAEMYGGLEMMAAKRLEHKSGRMISAANREVIQGACDQMKQGHEMVKTAHETLTALIADGAATDKTAGTPEVKAAPKPEPVPGHSATLSSKIQNVKEAFQWSPSNSN
jgi:hypothetical protein